MGNDENKIETIYTKGAEWRKWDLHFHTPSSYDYKDKSVTNENIIDELLKNEISVVAITDHHVIDVERIKNLQELAVDKGITILPGIEFLSDARGNEPIHFIGIFSESCNIDYIWGQIKNKTSICKIEGEGKKANEVYCDLIETITMINDLKGISTIHAGKKHGSIETITNALEHTMAQKEDIAKNIDIYEIGKIEDADGYIKAVFPAIGKRLPMVLCSDNHNIKNYELKGNCWIKADPNFEGLMQVLNEPEGRVYIGEKPEIFDRVNNNRTKYINELKISCVDGYDQKLGKWFQNISIPLNKELVAIIGHKGSGKSAIADIISLCSNYHDDKDFSFLTSRKFREKNGKIANKFKASLIWESGQNDDKGLNDNPDEGKLKGVKYLPQGQFERLTNEISTASEFQKEIEKVVFSHIDYSDRLGTYSFDELIEKKKRTIQIELNSLFEELEILNISLIKTENKSTTYYKKEIQNKLVQKNDELKALIEPPIVSDPNDDPEKKQKNEAIISVIDKLKVELATLEMDSDEKQEEKSRILIELKNLKDAKKELEIKSIEMEQFINEKKKNLLAFNINVERLISFSVDFTELDELIMNLENKLEKIKIILGDLNPELITISLNQQISEKQKQIKDEQAKLDSEQRKYQEFLNEKKIWEEEKRKILGNDSAPDTIKFYEKEMQFLESELSQVLEEQYDRRKFIVRNIYKKKQEIIAIYKEAKSRLTEIIEKNADTLKEYKIGIDASLVKKNDFNLNFFSFINHGKIGTYYSKEGAERQFLDITADINYDDEESVLILLDKLVDSIRFDKRDGQRNEERLVEEQIKEVVALYRYLFRLEFLDYNYRLKQGEKGIEQLSPGERGALLLVFYLLLDKNDIPLIIDQPEDNLDNHSVAKILVPFIQAAKLKRQIIMVTHNPNLAVVADAEQIIYVKLDKENNYEFSTISGSIENKLVNKKIVEVLEGDMPAFNNRRYKYHE